MDVRNREAEEDTRFNICVRLQGKGQLLDTVCTMTTAVPDDSVKLFNKAQQILFELEYHIEHGTFCEGIFKRPSIDWLTPLRDAINALLLRQRDLGYQPQFSSMYCPWCNQTLIKEFGREYCPDCIGQFMELWGEVLIACGCVID